jgi:hypothetical protein
LIIMNRSPMRLAIAVLAVLPFSSCTCHRDTPEPPPPRVAERPAGFAKTTPRRPPERKEGQITPKAVDVGELPTRAAVTPEVVTLPEDFPTDIPVFEDSEVMAVQELANDAHSVIFGLKENEAPKVFSFYKDSMSNKGWNVTQEYQGQEQSFLSFKKGNTITNVSVSKDPRSGKRIVAIMYYEEEDLPFPEF